MPGKQTLDHHADLMGRMAATLGVDLDEAELRGALVPEQRDDMLFSCTACADPTACGKWLETVTVADAPPSYCRNRDVLLDLAAE